MYISQTIVGQSLSILQSAVINAVFTVEDNIIAAFQSFIIATVSLKESNRNIIF